MRKKILERFPALLRLNLSLWGEPFLNKQIFDIIRIAQLRHIHVMIHSNFSLPNFDEEMAQRIIDSDLNELSLSIDGASQEAYEVYRRRGDFHLVMRNLELLRRLQNQQKKKNPTVTWKMVVNKSNEHEVLTAKEMAGRLGVEFLTVEIYVPNHLQADWKPSFNIEESGLRTRNNAPDKCYSLWQVMTVNFNGDVFPCCSEWSRRDSLGNVLREPVSHIWNSPEYKRRRQNNKSGPPACSDCHVDKETNFWRNWHPTRENDKNSSMLPILDNPACNRQ